MIRQGIRSTSKGGNAPTSKGEPGSTSKGEMPQHTSISPGQQQNAVVCSVPENELRNEKTLKGMIGTNQTGRFPVKSDCGHKRMFMPCNQDIDLICRVPMKNQKPKAVTTYLRAATTRVKVPPTEL